MKSIASNVPVREPFVEKLQRDTELVTQKLEQVKREGSALDEQVTALEKELERVRAGQPATDAQLSQKIRQLEHLVQQESKALNEEVERNQTLRRKIDVYRLERTHYRKTIGELTTKVARVSRQARVKNSEIKTSKSIDEHNKHMLLRLSRKRLSSQRDYSVQMFRLNTFLKDERQSRLGNNRKFSVGLESRLKQPTEMPKLSLMLQHLISRWHSKLADKKQFLDAYTSETNRLRQAFQNLREATGLPNVDAMVISIIKTDQQQFQLAELATQLSNEADTLEHSTEKMQSVVTSHDETQQVLAFSQHLANVKTRLSELLIKAEEDAHKIENVSASFSAMSEVLLELHQLLTSAFKFREFRVQHPQELDMDTLLLVMADIEECVGGVLVSRSCTLNEPSPMLKTLPLNCLNPRRSLKIGLKPVGVDDEMFGDLDDRHEVVTDQEFKHRALTITHQGSSRFRLPQSLARTPTAH